MADFRPSWETTVPGHVLSVTTRRKDRTMLKKMIFAASAAALLLPAAASAQLFQSDTADSDVIVTGPGGETRSVVVPINDLNLRSDRAVKIADRRVRRAAAKVCDESTRHSLYAAPDYRRCVTSAFNDARVDLNSAIYAVRAG
jgi:UrcA family protein